MKDFILKLKSKPEHVRHRIAVGTSAGVTAIIALFWVGTLATSGAFALATGPAVADANSEPFSLAGTNVESNFSQLLGAVGAATGATSSEPALTIVDGETSSSFDAAPPSNPTATVIPF